MLTFLISVDSGALTPPWCHTVWQQVDPGNKGNISKKNLHQVLMQLSVVISLEEVGAFVRHVADLRHGGDNYTVLPTQ